MFEDYYIDDYDFMFPKGNKRFDLFLDMLYNIRLLKYVKHTDLKLLPKDYSKICSKQKLLELVKMGILRTNDEDVFIATDKSLKLLKHFNKPVELLPSKIKGTGSINELNNTAVFIQAMKLPDFFHLFYKSFSPKDKINEPYIIPDALLVQYDKIESKYKLTFLEIEAKKPNWKQYLEDKRLNYLRLARDISVYNYWCNKCSLLGWEKPPINEFNFSVCFVCDTTRNWEDFFIFKKELFYGTSR